MDWEGKRVSGRAPFGPFFIYGTSWMGRNLAGSDVYKSLRHHRIGGNDYSHRLLNGFFHIY